MKVLDLGCGPGNLPFDVWKVSESDQITGVDVNTQDLEVARAKFPNRVFLSGSGESIPCGDNSFDRVICSVSLNYMDIPKALEEMRRVLKPGGILSLSVLPASFTIREMREAFPRPIPTLFRFWVLGNGVWFWITGKTLHFINGRVECFQSKRGMRRALARAGFEPPSFYWRPGNMSKVLVVDSREASDEKQLSRPLQIRLPVEESDTEQIPRRAQG